MKRIAFIIILIMTRYDLYSQNSVSLGGSWSLVSANTPFGVIGSYSLGMGEKWSFNISARYSFKNTSDSLLLSTIIGNNGTDIRINVENKRRWPLLYLDFKNYFRNGNNGDGGMYYRFGGLYCIQQETRIADPYDTNLYKCEVSPGKNKIETLSSLGIKLHIGGEIEIVDLLQVVIEGGYDIYLNPDFIRLGISLNIGLRYQFLKL